MSIIEPATVRTVRTATQYTIDIDGGIVIVVLSPSANGFSGLRGFGSGHDCCNPSPQLLNSLLTSSPRKRILET